MLIYEATKAEFMDDVFSDQLSEKIRELYLKKVGKANQSEINAWDQSMQYMFKVLSTDAIPAKSGVAIEFKIPATSKRVDFIITGLNSKDNESAVIVELKQWQELKSVPEKDAVVITRFKAGEQETAHPSYQAYSYACTIKNYNEMVQTKNISLHPCAYLHNYVSRANDPLFSTHYKEYLDQAPSFVKGDALKLQNFICKYIKRADDKEVLYHIESGKIKPSKALQDALVRMLRGKEEFLMLDTQKVIYETALFMSKQSFNTDAKQVMIVEGGPGTGKSVLAINLLVNLTKLGMVCQYVTKNSAPRYVYQAMLQAEHKKSFIDNLFKGSGCYVESSANELDVLLVDEAHRLGIKSGMFNNKGENQTKEIINAAKFSVFFIDECQKVTASDYGSKEEIIRFAEAAGAKIVELELDSQFRCNGSDAFLTWLDDVLEIRETANEAYFEHDYDYQVIDDPNLLREMILERNAINNKARIVAGYCWDWPANGRNRTDSKDIKIPEYNFEMSWNLGSTQTWAIDSNSVSEAGCIHTSQGLEFDYVGVIVGKDLRYEDGSVITDYTRRASTDKSLNGVKGKCQKGDADAIRRADEIIRNTYRTLMTRGQKGCYIYCEDKALGEYIKRRLMVVEYGEGGESQRIRVAERDF